MLARQYPQGWQAGLCDTGNMNCRYREPPHTCPEMQKSTHSGLGSGMQEARKHELQRRWEDAPEG